MSDLSWEIASLSQNLNPMDSFGKELSSISAVSSSLKDKDVQALAKAFELNSVFSGGLYLQENLITDLGILYLTKSLSTSACRIIYLNLSYNNLKEKSGIYIGDLLNANYPIKELYLRGNCVETLGVQRICESFEICELQILDIGIIHDSGLTILSKYLPRCKNLKELTFQQGDTWTKSAQGMMVSSLKENYSLLAIEVINCEDSQFVEEVLSVVDRNREVYAQNENEMTQALRLDPKNFAAEIQSYIEESIQNLPVRVYLTNSLGTLLNDGIFQLMKFRFKENNPSRNTAVNNIKWLVRFILDKSKV